MKEHFAVLTYKDFTSNLTPWNDWNFLFEFIIMNKIYLNNTRVADVKNFSLNSKKIWLKTLKSGWTAFFVF